MHGTEFSPQRQISLFGILLILAVPWVTSCHGKNSGQKDAAWYGFAAYPGARDLCTMFVLGTKGEELHWRSFATSDPPDRVGAFYTQKEPGAVVNRGASVTLEHGDDTTLSIHPASADYPKCTETPHTGENTVIVVSHIVSRGR